jgi:SAM-dependent methyltransferase
LKQYLRQFNYLVGLDIAKDKILKTEHLNLYDSLIVADAKTHPFKNFSFDLLVALEVLHELPHNNVFSLEELVRPGGAILLSLPRLPGGCTVENLHERGYNVYRYLLRGFILIDLKRYNIFLASGSIFFKMLRLVLTTLGPILRALGLFRKGYLVAFKSINREH